MHQQETTTSPNLNRLSVSATVHCLTGCAIGEVSGMALGTALGWGNLVTTLAAIVLAFFFGYGLTSLPLFRGGLALSAVVPISQPDPRAEERQQCQAEAE